MYLKKLNLFWNFFTQLSSWKIIFFFPFLRSLLNILFSFIALSCFVSFFLFFFLFLFSLRFLSLSLRRTLQPRNSWGFNQFKSRTVFLVNSVLNSSLLDILGQWRGIFYSFTILDLLRQVVGSVTVKFHSRSNVKHLLNKAGW